MSDPSAAEPGPSGSRRGDAVAAVVLVALAVGIVVESRRWPEAVGFAGDPLVLPRSLALLMTIVAATLLVRAWRNRRYASSSGGAGGSGRKVLQGVAATALLGLLLEPLGLIVAAAVYLLAMQRITGAPKGRAIGIAVVVPVLIWLVFHSVLNVPLPAGAVWGLLPGVSR